MRHAHTWMEVKTTRLQAHNGRIAKFLGPQSPPFPERALGRHRHREKVKLQDRIRHRTILQDVPAMLQKTVALPVSVRAMRCSLRRFVLRADSDSRVCAH